MATAGSAENTDDAERVARFGDDWVAELVTASAGLDGASHSAVVEITIGKRRVVLSIVEGRVVGAGEDAAVTVTVPVTSAQLEAFGDGSESMARAYMRGDLKPVGSTGSFLALLELFENPAFRDRLAAR